MQDAISGDMAISYPFTWITIALLSSVWTTRILSPGRIPMSRRRFPDESPLKTDGHGGSPLRVNLRHLEEANLNLSRAILSALRLGDIRFLDHSVGWLNGLLENYGLSPDLADQYYIAFRQAVQQHMGSQAAPIHTPSRVTMDSCAPRRERCDNA